MFLMQSEIMAAIADHSIRTIAAATALTDIQAANISSANELRIIEQSRPVQPRSASVFEIKTILPRRNGK